MNVRDLVFALVGKMGSGKTIETRNVYTAMHDRFPSECEALGFTLTKPIEERWKKDIRLALLDAKTQGLIKHVGSAKSGFWERI